MEDPSCDWVVTVRLLSLSAVPGVAGRLEMNAQVPLKTNVITGQVSGAARMNVAGEMKSLPPCSVVYQPTTTESGISGQERGGKLALLVSYAAFALQGQAACDLPVGQITIPSTIPMEAMKDFALTVEARDGATVTDERAGITVTVHRAQ